MTLFEKDREEKILNIIRAIRKNEKQEKKTEIIKVNYKVLIDPKTKLITPFVTLMGGAIIALVGYFQRWEQVKWYIILCSVLVLFMILGAIIQFMVEKFELDIVKKEIDDRLEEERAREEAEAAEAAAGEEGLEDIPHEGGPIDQTFEDEDAAF